MVRQEIGHHIKTILYMSKKTKSADSKYSYGSSYSYGSTKRGSSFWYDEYDYDYDYLDQWGSTYTPKQLESYKKTNNLYKLASVRRAIANFVQIVTNKPVPVTPQEGINIMKVLVAAKKSYETKQVVHL
jgi:predicted dehydrogenase